MQVHKGWIRYTELEEDKKITIGQLAVDQEKNRKFNTHCAQDQVDEELKSYPDRIIECINNGKKHFDGDFYIQVLLCMSRIIPDERKNIFSAQEDCPKPFFDQFAYKYYQKEDRLEVLWVMPDQDLCELYRYNIGLVPDDEKDLYGYIRQYYNGDLAKIEYFENNKAPKQVFSVTRS